MHRHARWKIFLAVLQCNTITRNWNCQVGIHGKWKLNEWWYTCCLQVRNYPELSGAFAQNTSDAERWLDAKFASCELAIRGIAPFSNTKLRPVRPSPFGDIERCFSSSERAHVATRASDAFNTLRWLGGESHWRRNVTPLTVTLVTSKQVLWSVVIAGACNAPLFRCHCQTVSARTWIK